MQDIKGRREPAFGRVIVGMAALGGVVALATALMVTISVSSRYLGFGGISGDFDLVQTGIAVAIFCFMPLTQWRRGHIVVDTFSARWPPALTRAVDAVWDVVQAAAIAIIAWCMLQGARDALASNLSSMVLSMPLAPYFFAGAALLGLLALTALATAFRRLSDGA